MATTDLIGALPVEAVQFRLQYRQELSRQAGGSVLVADVGDPLWIARLTIARTLLDDFADIEALVDVLDGGINTFYCWNPGRQYPIADPGGTVLGASSVAINSVGGDGKSLSLKGLPASYALTRGDMLSFVYSSTHVALHRLMESATADGSGDTAEFEVRPHVRTGAAEDDVVTLARPYAEMMLEPNSYEPTMASLFGQASLSALQVV